MSYSRDIKAALMAGEMYRKNKPALFWQDVQAMGMDLEIGYHDDPEQPEIVHVVRLSDTGDRNDQTEITGFLNDKAFAEIEKLMMEDGDGSV